MSYSYAAERHRIFTEDGQVMFLKMLYFIQSTLKIAGAVRSSEVMGSVTGDTWLMTACLDRMVELGEIKELTGPEVWGQHRVFVGKRES